HGTARGERARRRGVPRIARTRLERDLPGAAREQVRAARGQVPAARSRRRVLVRLRRRTGGRTRADPQRHSLVPSRERRGCEEPYHPSGKHDASAAERRRVGGGRCRAGNDQALCRDRIRRRPDLGSRTRTRTPEMSGLTRYQEPMTIQKVLFNASTVAIVGLSGNELRASNFVGYYL